MAYINLVRAPPGIPEGEARMKKANVAPLTLAQKIAYALASLAMAKQSLAFNQFANASLNYWVAKNYAPTAFK